MMKLASDPLPQIIEANQFFNRAPFYKQLLVSLHKILLAKGILRMMLRYWWGLLRRVIILWTH